MGRSHARHRLPALAPSRSPERPPVLITDAGFAVGVGVPGVQYRIVATGETGWAQQWYNGTGLWLSVLLDADPQPGEACAGFVQVSTSGGGRCLACESAECRHALVAAAFTSALEEGASVLAPVARSAEELRDRIRVAVAALLQGTASVIRPRRSVDGIAGVPFPVARSYRTAGWYAVRTPVGGTAVYVERRGELVRLSTVYDGTCEACGLPGCLARRYAEALDATSSASFYEGLATRLRSGDITFQKALRQVTFGRSADFVGAIRWMRMAERCGCGAHLMLSAPVVAAAGPAAVCPLCGGSGLRPDCEVFEMTLLIDGLVLETVSVPAEATGGCPVCPTAPCLHREIIERYGKR